MACPTQILGRALTDTIRAVMLNAGLGAVRAASRLDASVGCWRAISVEQAVGLFYAEGVKLGVTASGAEGDVLFGSTAGWCPLAGCGGDGVDAAHGGAGGDCRAVYDGYACKRSVLMGSLEVVELAMLSEGKFAASAARPRVQRAAASGRQGRVSLDILGL